MIKKCIFFLSLLVTPFIVLAYPKGDVDGDNHVKSNDYILVRKHILKQTTLTGDKKTRADVNGDGNVNSADFVAIRKIIINGGSVEPTTTPKPTSTPTQPLSEADKICESVKNNKTIDYKSFEKLNKKSKSSDKNKDSFYAMQAAHDCANKYNKDVKITKDTYHIYRRNKETITVKTNTDLNNSTIYIHDENDVAGKGASGHIFSITSGCKTIKNTQVGDIKKGSVIEALKGAEYGYYAKVTDTNDKRRIHIRYGNNANSGGSVRDAFRVDKNGKILDYIAFSYANSTVNIEYCAIPAEKLTFKNATIYTIADNTTPRSVKSGTGNNYLRRGISIERSNTVIDNISHAIILPGGQGATGVNHGYFGFFAIHGVANVTIKNSKVYSVKNNNDNVNSTYDIIIQNAANITFKNVVAYDYDGKSSYFSKSSNLLKNDIWGMTQSGDAKTVTYDGCVLNRIDSHTGTYDLTVKNSKVGSWAFTLIGGGDLIIDNVDVYYSNIFINLRKDYGSTWDGNVTIRNSSITPGNYNNVSLVKFWLSFDGNYLHNFGYDIHLPNIDVDNFKVKSNVSKLYVFYNDTADKYNLKTVSSKIKNNEFKFFYPKKKDIKVTNVSNNSKKISVANYYHDFGEN